MLPPLGRLNAADCANSSPSALVISHGIYPLTCSFYIPLAGRSFIFAKHRSCFLGKSKKYIWIFYRIFFLYILKLNGQWQNFIQFSLPCNPKFKSKLSRPCLSTPKYRQSSLLPCLVSIVTILSHKTSHGPAFNNSLVHIRFKKFTKR